MTAVDTSIALAPMRAEHANAVLAIYAAGIASGTATFESSAPTWDQFDATHLADHRFVALDGDDVVGWVAVSPVSGRCVYAGVVESSLYVAPHAQDVASGARSPSA